jgi:hypothetical protein
LLKTNEEFKKNYSNKEKFLSLDVGENHTTFDAIDSRKNIVQVYAYRAFWIKKNNEWDQFLSRFKQALRDLTPVPDVAQAVQEFREKHEMNSHHWIGLHYRSWGKATGDAGWKVEKGGLGEFAAPMEKFITQYPDVRFYLASDDLSVRDYFTKTYGERIFFYPASAVERETVAGQQLGLIDMLLLSSTAEVIGTYKSTFSDVAALSTPTMRKHLVGPRGIFPNEKLTICFDEKTAEPYHCK